jgi:hypothetical protein
MTFVTSARLKKPETNARFKGAVVKPDIWRLAVLKRMLQGCGEREFIGCSFFAGVFLMVWVVLILKVRR